MISVFLPVEDYYLNYESKVENSFVNAIPPQKKFVPPSTKSPVSSRSHPHRSPRKAPAYLPASPPSYPEESSQSLPEKGGSLPHLASIRTKRKFPYTLQHHHQPMPQQGRVHCLSPLSKELIHLLQPSTPKPHKFPSLRSPPKRTKRAKKPATSLPPNKSPLSLSASSPFTSLLRAPLQHPQKQPYGRSQRRPTVDPFLPLQRASSPSPQAEAKIKPQEAPD